MQTQSYTLSKTLYQVLLATLVLTALALLAPGRSEAAIRVKARFGKVQVAVNRDRCCTLAVGSPRKVVVRSSGRERIVVRNEYPRHGACRRIGAGNHRRHHNEIWVPGHFQKKVNRHGRLKKVWIPGHWTFN